MDDFLSYLRLELNRSPLTVEAYQHDIAQFADWLGVASQALVIPDAVTANDIRAWISSLASGSVSPSSLRRKVQSLRALFRWAAKRKLIPSNPADPVVLAKTPKYLPRIVRHDEIENLLSSIPTDDPNGLRQHLAVNIIYSLGLRQAELLSLTDADIRPASAGYELRVLGKGDKQRIIPLPDSLMQEIKLWQTVRDSVYPDLPAPAPLIAGRNGHIAKETLYKWIHTLLQNTSASRKSPHTLRHSFATSMVANGANLDAVRAILGHASLSTTQIYTHLSPAQIRQAYINSHPRAKKK